MHHLTRPLALAAGLAALWGTLAWFNDPTTYHLAPLLVSGVAALGAFGDEEASTAQRLIASLIGTALALVVTATLGTTDHLTGPSLLPVGGAVLEAAVFAVAGGLVGVGVALVRRSRVGA